MPTSVSNDIRPPFRDSPDVDSMQGYGLDLSSYEVKAGASETYVRLADGNMPCDEPWALTGSCSSRSGWTRAARRNGPVPVRQRANLYPNRRIHGTTALPSTSLPDQ